MILAADIGGTKIAAARVRADGTIDSDVLQITTPATHGAAAVLAATRSLLEGLRTPEVTVVGVSSAGVINSQLGMVVAATSSIAGWAGTPVADRLRDDLGLPVHMLGDGHAFGLGEAVYGVGRGQRSLLLLAVGTGVGGSYVEDGRPQLGAHHVAGHFGHIAVPHAAGLPCPCGRTGHLEAIAGGAGILSWYHGHGGDPTVTSARELFAGPGDGVAAKALNLAGAALGTGAASLANALDPTVVVVAGGLAQPGTTWERAAQQAFGDHLVPALDGLRLTLSTAGTTTALRGAAHYALAHAVPVEHEPGRHDP